MAEIFEAVLEKDKKLKAFRQALVDVRDVKLAAVQVMKTAIPVNSTVTYYHGDKERTGIVVDHDKIEARIHIRTPTRKYGWIDAARVEKVERPGK